MDRKTPGQEGIRGYYRSRLSSIVSEGLDPFPSCVFELEVLLNASVVDLAKVTRALGSDIRFNRRVLRMSNEILLPSNTSAQTITDAVVLLGPCLFHTAVLLCAVTQFGPHEYRHKNAKALWSHGVQTAFASERIAERSGYPSLDAAFTAGLLHDVGYLPLLTVAREREEVFGQRAPLPWQDNIELERDLFGLDHCQIGRWMAKSWRFSPSVADAIAYHHDPSEAEADAQLAEIVFKAETDSGWPRERQDAPIC